MCVTCNLRQFASMSRPLVPSVEINWNSSMGPIIIQVGDISKSRALLTGLPPRVLEDIVMHHTKELVHHMKNTERRMKHSPHQTENIAYGKKMYRAFLIEVVACNALLYPEDPASYRGGTSGKVNTLSGKHYHSVLHDLNGVYDFAYPNHSYDE